MKGFHLLNITGAIFLLTASSLMAETPTPSMRGSAEDRKDVAEIIAQSTDAYRAVLHGKHGAVPKSVLNSATCAAIFPNVVTAALGVGGMHGDGIAFCKNAGGTWGGPLFLDLTGGSLGIQAGVTSADVVLFMNADNAKTALAEGNFRMSGELSAVAGTFDETFRAPQRGVVAYTRTEGVFAGASLNGTSIGRDRDEEKAFYGATLDQARVFNEAPPSRFEQSIDRLRKLLPMGG